MILHTKDGRKVRGAFVEKCRNAIIVHSDNEGPKAIGVDQIASVERQRADKVGRNERGKPVHPKDVNLRWGV